MSATVESFKEIGARLSNWGRWGAEDQLGTLNLITPECRVAAARLVEDGRTIDLSMSLSASGPQKHGAIPGRFDPIHLMTMLQTDDARPGGTAFADDVLIMPLQAGTQWDSLAHAGYDGLLYNGVPASTITTSGASVNAIDAVVKAPVGRGVLLDVPRLTGRDRLDPREPVTAADLEAVAQAQRVEVRSGDILLVRTGWFQYFHEGDLTTFMQQEVPGLDLSCCVWLHERGVAAVANDTYCLEVRPSLVSEATEPVHMVLIRDLGMTLGELFDLEELARSCDERNRWDFFLAAAPLKVAGAVGSPITPLALT